MGETKREREMVNRVRLFKGQTCLKCLRFLKDYLSPSFSEA